MTALRPLRPARLEPGDLVGIIAPSSPPPDPGAVDQAVAGLERLGFRPRLARNVRARHGFLAGTDRERAADLMAVFNDAAVRGIICLRGGYGGARLLDLLDYAAIRRHPKVFAGYSDITSLHTAFNRRTGLITFHAPMLNRELSALGLSDYVRDSFLRTVTQPKPAGSLRVGYAGPVEVLRKGQAEGRLIGGNLSVLCGLIGTPYAPNFRGRILFLEDVGEKPYRLDRMLTHLALAGVFRQVAGVAAGLWKDCEDPTAATAKEFRQSSQDVLRERLGRLKIPVVLGLPFGHVELNATLPVGARAHLDARQGDLVITEAAVK